MKRSLIVEDNEMNRDVLSRRLERRGYAVLMTHDRLSAIAMADTLRPRSGSVSAGLRRVPAGD